MDEREELKPLGQLLAQGKITQEEFDRARAKILAAGENLPCPACGASNPADAQTCFNCGVLLRGERFVCPDCGADLPSGDSTGCPGCGARFAA
ncbi:MAG TPA: zinc ribbon domain-containing protein, partial [Methanomicrobiales archaeon]|nr:zinc ribbon domain-containing protein [Methanomicrobiales archaeon]